MHHTSPPPHNNYLTYLINSKTTTQHNKTQIHHHEPHPGDGKVLMMCCVAPEMDHSQETLGSLRFASKVAKVDAAAMRPCPKCTANKSGNKAGVAKKQAQWA